VIRGPRAEIWPDGQDLIRLSERGLARLNLVLIGQSFLLSNLAH
jgi:hypothetical protein